MTNNELFNAVDDVCEMLYDSYGYNLIQEVEYE